MTVPSPSVRRTLRSSEAREVILRWFGTLHSEHKRAERAQLRRCRTLHDVMWHREYYALQQHLDAENIHTRSSDVRGSEDEEALAAIVSLLAHAKQHQTNAQLGRQLAGGSSHGRGLSDMRFRRLLATQTTAELLPHARRALHMLEGTVDVRELTRIVAAWKPDAAYASPRDNPRLRLAEEFYAVTSK